MVLATLHFTGTDRKVFTPISTALSNLRNATAATIIVLVKQTTTGARDFAGVTDSSGGNFYHDFLTGASAGRLGDDDGLTFINSSGSWTQDTTNWYLVAVDWSATMGSLQRFHYRDQTGLSAWTHQAAGGNNGSTAASPGTSGWLRIGYVGDFSTAAVDKAVVAIWSGTRFSDGDYGDFRKTSDLANHALGAPQFLCELTASTLVDLMGSSTYSSANGSGTTLTGADPDNWTFDGTGSAAAASVPNLVMPTFQGAY